MKSLEELINIVGIGKKNNDMFLYTPLLKRVFNNVIMSNRGEDRLIEVEDLFISLLDEGEGVVNGICESVYDMALFATEGGKITINGGQFIGNNANKTFGARYALNSKDENKKTETRESGDFIVKGGDFVGYDPSNSASENPVANFVAEGFKVVENAGVYTVVVSEGTVYASTEEASAVSSKLDNGSFYYKLSK